MGQNRPPNIKQNALGAGSGVGVGGRMDEHGREQSTVMYVYGEIKGKLIYFVC